MNIAFSKTSIGKIGIAEAAGKITNVYFATDIIPSALELKETALLRDAFQQLNAYLKGTLKAFSLPIAPAGTIFRQQVWQLLDNIPYGTTATYKDIAIALGNPQSVRAVGQANQQNPIPLFIPCHRIISSNGKLVGYRGGLAIKATLLEMEKQGLANP
ncbi:MAG: methylated-DNA--[protein]-cysteine S-methyltransferase [Snowella sp.]|nr:methylated-DNA--[protein]-cysteine S-methyltransferase [Snowella sp.]